ncbi:hypothetical protein M440DRAFT_1093105 [Trichoderma longibrachiatum ATCC 18648]|uniref:Uncharacterized protein n=1 Tax=Trichoderma longibrachiatum ATCC 18648 TaxID=983965 RepID=A0A2T4BSC3_TRILO|nr:hypothetical protein M440DRAFT_1093105 [Trichoderma longibrachiatum ATCC 18648]
MSTQRERMAGPDGTKVTLGKNAPETHEGTGAVPSESLAAQSAHSGGEFSHNRVTEVASSVSSARPKNDEVSGVDPKTAVRGLDYQGAPAPTYVVDQYITGKGGPHGKNIKEGIDESELRDKESDGLHKALRAEPGSENDPSRLAEERLLEKDALRPEPTGARQGGIEGGTKYDKLESETSA